MNPRNGIYTLDEIEKLITPRTKILVASHVQYSSGFKPPLNELGELCRKHNLTFVVNATQSGMILPIDVKRAHVDYLVYAGYKWTCAGFGNGILYINKRQINHKTLPIVGSESVVDWEAMNNKAFHIRSDASALEVGAPNFAPILIRSIGQDTNQQQIFKLNTYLVNKLSEQKGDAVVSQLDSKYRSGITFLKVPEAKRIVSQLTKKGVIVSLR